MESLNSVLLEGFLAKDPELSHGENGAAICSFNINSIRGIKVEAVFIEEVSRLHIIARERLAEICAEHIHEGQNVRVVGRLKQEGEKVWIEAESVEFRSSKRTEEK
jgi:single-stranded DNA-binding protein